ALLADVGEEAARDAAAEDLVRDAQIGPIRRVSRGGERRDEDVALLALRAARDDHAALAGGDRLGELDLRRRRSFEGAEAFLGCRLRLREVDVARDDDLHVARHPELL